MANKQTKRERKDMARRERLEQMRRAQRRAVMRKITSFGSVVLVLALIVGLILWNNHNNAVKRERDNRVLNTVATAAGCGQLQTPANQGQEHIKPPETFNYNSDPPTSGSHYAEANFNGPTTTGIHQTPIQNEVEVHNLEHGHIGIQYADKLPADIKKPLEDFTRAHDEWVFLAPRPTLPNGEVLVFTAWTRLLPCGATLKDDPAAVKKLAETFYDKFQNKGPESIAGTPG